MRFERAKAPSSRPDRAEAERDCDSLEGLGGSEPGKTSTDHHNALHALPHFVIQSRILAEM